jgi:hypothetical protein
MIPATMTKKTSLVPKTVPRQLAAGRGAGDHLGHLYPPVVRGAVVVRVVVGMMLKRLQLARRRRLTAATAAGLPQRGG